MRIRASIVGFLLVGVLGSAGEWTRYCTRFGESLEAWRRNYNALEGQKTLDRLVLTVMLAELQASPPPEKQTGRTQGGVRPVSRPAEN